MKFFFTVLIAALTLPAMSQDNASINWMTFEEVSEAMKTTPKKVMIDIYTPWCGPCKMMMATTFKDPGVVKYINENFYAIKFNAEGPETVDFNGKEYKNDGYDKNKGKNSRNSMHDLTRFFSVPGYPTIIILDTDFSIKKKSPGYRDASRLMELLKSVA